MKLCHQYFFHEETSMPLTLALNRDHHSGLDWRALALVAILHSVLYMLLFDTPMRDSGQLRREEMVLVRLWDPASTKPKESSRQAALTSAAAQHDAKRGREKAVVGPRTPAKHEVAEKKIVKPDGQDVRTTGASISGGTTSEPTPEESVTSDGVRPSLATAGNGSYTGPRFRPARVERRYKPDYPLDALRAHKEGTTDVLVDVSASGKATEAHVYQSSNDASLDAAAVAATLAYNYKPAEKNGIPTAAQAIVTIDWRIDGTTVEHYLVASPKESKDVQQMHACWMRGARNTYCRNPGDRYHPHGDPETPDYHQSNDY